MYLGLRQNLQTHLLRAYIHNIFNHRNEGFEANRLRVGAQKQMLHGGVAGGDNFIHLVRRDLSFLQEPRDKSVQRPEDDLVQLGEPILVDHGVTDAGDHVGPMYGLPIEG